MASGSPSAPPAKPSAAASQSATEPNCPPAIPPLEKASTKTRSTYPRTSVSDGYRITSLKIGRFPRGAIAAGFGSVWVVPSAKSQVLRLDPSTNKITAEIPIGAVSDVAVGAGSLWTTGRLSNCGGVVYRVDAKTGRVLGYFHAPAQSPSHIAAAQGQVWVSGRRSVSRLDPRTGKVVETVGVGGDPTGIAITGGAVWVIASGAAGATVKAGDIVKIDPKKNKVVAKFRVHAGEFALAASPDSAWTQSGGRAVRIDSGTGSVTMGPVAFDAGWPVAATKKGAWFLITQPSFEIAHISARTMKIDQEVGLPDVGLAIPPPAAVLEPNTDSIWVVNYEHSITRIDVEFG